ncbi:MAG: ribonuclease P protein component [Actinobacteria bacterium]|nr:MAG: ribonuclease P protein component [Actinomycetota bacterium]
MIQPVRDRASFAALRRSGRRVRRGPLTLTFVPGAPDDPLRVAYAIGRTVGGAVVRNLLRRRLRVVVSELGPLLQPGAYLIAAAPGAASLSFGELRAAVAEALEDLLGTRNR